MMVSSPTLESLMASGSKTQRAFFSPPPWKYDVFLSFYGQDTRKGFTDHLYAGLTEKGLIVFRDDEKLEQGKYIFEELPKAIKESFCAVVVISENYAFSKWCLNELAKIVECRKDRGLIVYPVFYHVNPSDVRNQRKSFAKAFGRHGEDPKVDEEKMMTWRAALRDVGYSAGWHIDHNRYESIIVKEIIEKILGQFPLKNGLSRRKHSLLLDIGGVSGPNTQLILNSFSDLSSLISLDLSYCNLSDGAVPNDLGYLSSLEILNLSGNKFARIPDSICQLSNLESLYLRKCSRLQALPKLPLSLTYLNVENCPLLEMLSDEIYTRNLSEILGTTDCSLAAMYTDYDGGSPCNILQLDLRRYLQTQGYWRRFFGTKVICGSWLGPGIPKWFNNKSADSSVKLEMHPDLNDNREWKGCALFVVYEVHEQKTSNSIEGSDPTLYHFVFHFETDEGRLDIPIVLPVPNFPSIGATGFWVYIPAKWFLEVQSKKLDGWSCVEALILSDSLAVEVKECGMRLVCSQHDALEFYEALNIIGHDLDLENYHPPLYRL